jgi:hypothetical protein
MKLELKHLAPYLPYGLTGQIDLKDVPISHRNGDNIRIKTLDAENIPMFLTYSKPILRPLSDLHKPIQDNGNWTIPANYLYRNFDVTDMEFNGNIIDPKHGYDVYMFLISHHFDVFGLIEKGHAIDINTLTPPKY